MICCFHNPDHPIRLKTEFHRDLSWWLEFFASWNGVSFFPILKMLSLPDTFVSSDAATSQGFGAI
jgi:hypothetical protein